MLYVPEQPTLDIGRGLCLPYAYSALTDMPIDDAIRLTGYDKPRPHWRTILQAIPEYAVLLYAPKASDVARGWHIMGRKCKPIPRKALRWHIDTGTITKGLIVTKHRYAKPGPIDHAIALDEPLVSDNGELILAREYWRRQVKFAWIW